VGFVVYAGSVVAVERRGYGRGDGRGSGSCAGVCWWKRASEIIVGGRQCNAMQCAR
jgi:hypothetical protein